MDGGIHACPAQRMLIDRPPHHHPVHPFELVEALVEGLEAAIELDGEPGPLALELVHQVVAQGWNRAVLFGVEPLQPGLAGMHGKALAAGGGQGVHKGQQLGIGIAFVDADAVLHRHG